MIKLTPGLKTHHPFWKVIFTAVTLSWTIVCNAQPTAEKDSVVVARLFKLALTQGKGYETLRHLCKNIGPRLSGSKGAADAVAYTKQELEKLKADKVWLQDVMVTHWERGEKETCRIVKGKGVTEQNLAACALGGSIPTPAAGITAQVLEVKGLKELEKLPKGSAKGKIVFYNGPMPAEALVAFHAYGATAGQRGGGAMEAARFGAVAVLVRSLNLRLDDFPHTGAMRYHDTIPQIPAMAISTQAADLLSAQLAKHTGLSVYLKQSCRTLPDAPSHNVIAELRGSEKPEEVIVVSGHLDAWDLAEGAHDDGAGCVQAIEVLRLFQQAGIRPKRTIRVVLFMNEENGLRGGRGYADWAKTSKEKHLAAMESDRGGFSPRGFSFGGSPAVLTYVRQWQPLLAKFGLGEWVNEGGGADISRLEGQCPLLGELLPDSQRYFDYHHAATDTFETVNKRELELGTASLAAITYLLDKYGLPVQ